MLIMDVLPDMPDAQSPVVLIAQAENATTRGSKSRELVVGKCLPVYYRQGPVDLKDLKALTNGLSGAMLSPNNMVWTYLVYYEKQELTADSYPSIHDIQVVRQPKHGKIIPVKSWGEWEDRLFYIPNEGYVGDDRVDFRVLVEGQPVRFVQFFKVTKLCVDCESGEADRLCKHGSDLRKIPSVDAINPDVLPAQVRALCPNDHNIPNPFPP